MRKYLFFLLGFLLFNSCSLHIEKRIYRKGYHVEFTANKRIRHIDNSTSFNKNELNGKMPLGVNSERETTILIPSSVEFVKSETSPDENMVASISETEPVVGLNYTLKEQPAIDEGVYGLGSSKNSELKTVELDKAAIEDRNEDMMLYGLAALTGFLIFGLFRVNQKLTLKVTRWASKNKWSTKGIIALLQIGIGYLGVKTGMAFSDLGYNFSNGMEYIFGGIMAASFLNLILRKKKDEVMVLRSFYLRKLSHLAIVSSLFMVSIGIGNKLADHRMQISPLGYAVEKADIAISGTTGDSINDPAKDDAKSSRSIAETKDIKRKRNGWPAWYIIVYIFMCLALIVLSCLPFCLGSTAAGIPVIIASIALIIIVPILMARRVRLGTQFPPCPQD